MKKVSLFPWAGLVFLGVGLLGTKAQAQDFRYSWQTPGADPYFSNPLDDVGGRARNQRIVVEGDFGPGAGRKFGGVERAYVGDNQPIVGDFNGDGWDDIGVHWTSGEHNGKWTFSLNDKKGAFQSGQVADVGGGTTSYIGANTAFAGDFNGDGWDDIGVQWTSGEHKGQWVISLNRGTAQPSFGPGAGATIDGQSKAFEGAGTPVVGDFNVDGWDDLGAMWGGGANDGRFLVALNEKKASVSFARTAQLTFGDQHKAFVGASKQAVVCDFDGNGLPDVGVHWTSGSKAGQWELALNTSGAALRVPRPLWVGNERAAYQGPNEALCGRFDGGKFAGLGVRWNGGTNNGLWVFSSNTAKERITKTPRYEVRMPVVFLNFAGAPVADHFTDASAKAQLDEVRSYYLAASHGAIDFAFKYKVVNLAHSVKWTGNAPNPSYNTDGTLTNGAAYPANKSFTGYWCRFSLPGSTDGQIIFKNAKGNLAWTDNSNIHRNYCQVAERNMAKDALGAWSAANNSELLQVLGWASKNGKAPIVSYIGVGMPGGGNRTFKETINDQWPLTGFGPYSFVDYIYQDRGASTLAHELGHFLGLSDLYYHKTGEVCGGRTVEGRAEGHLGSYALMGNQHAYFPDLSAPHRFRLGLSDGQYLTKAAGKTHVVALEPTMQRQSAGHSLSIVHPDPMGHPNELWLLENRRTSGNWEKLDHQGLYVYHLLTTNTSDAKPYIDLEENPASCGAGPLRPFRWDQGTRPLKFHDGKAAGFKLSYKQVGDKIIVTVTFD